MTAQPPMNPVNEVILRAVHAAGVVPHAALAQRLGADMPRGEQLSNKLSHLSRMGWLERCGGATKAQRWRVTAAGAPWLARPERLPRAPVQRPPAPRTSVRGSVMGARNAALLRLVLRLGTATTTEMRQCLIKQGLGAVPTSRLHNACSSLADRGWLLKVDAPTDACRRGLGRPSVGWRLADEAAPHLAGDGPIALNPFGRPLAARPAPPALPAPVPVRRHEHLAQPLRLPPAPPVRPGALDFLAIPSHGACR